MGSRTATKQSEHDAAVLAAAQIYRDHRRIVWVNPGTQKNKPWAGRYIDVIASLGPGLDKAWVVEIETDDSVSESEATEQWTDYSQVYGGWHLAVPVASKGSAERLLQQNGITNCSIVTWARDEGGPHRFWGLPGLDS